MDLLLSSFVIVPSYLKCFMGKTTPVDEIIWSFYIFTHNF